MPEPVCQRAVKGQRWIGGWQGMGNEGGNHFAADIDTRMVSCFAFHFMSLRMPEGTDALPTVCLGNPFFTNIIPPFRVLNPIQAIVIPNS